MPDKAIVFAVTIVLFIALFFYMIEYFIPLSANADMKNECRKTLIKMEDQGGLSSTEKADLQAKLAQRGFTNIAITAPAHAKQGEELSLRVEADYMYSRITGLFKRDQITQHMVYHKYAASRRVVN